MLFVGDDWAEDHHDVEIEDDAGGRLARRRLPEGLAGIAQLHGLIAACMPAEWADLADGEAAGRVKVGIETERGRWVQALVAAGYEVFPLNPMSVARYRERHSTSGAKSDSADAHLLAEIVWLDREHHRPVAGDSSEAEAVKLVRLCRHYAVGRRPALRARVSGPGGSLLPCRRQPVARVVHRTTLRAFQAASASCRSPVS